PAEEALIAERLEDQPTDPTEAVDRDLDCHLVPPAKRSGFARRGGSFATVPGVGAFERRVGRPDQPDCFVLSTETFAPPRGSATRCSRMRANVFDRSVFTAGTYRKAGERIDVCPFGSCGLLIERSFMSVNPLFMCAD
ncbi:MAG TPA: hypothetical protein VML91_26535, partial [Burkholderiales bacterium]|nr:hypothetical protein [Burkholderiales bacterium]